MLISVNIIAAQDTEKQTNCDSLFWNNTKIEKTLYEAMEQQKLDDIIKFRITFKRNDSGLHSELRKATKDTLNNISIISKELKKRHNKILQDLPYTRNEILLKFKERDSEFMGLYRELEIKHNLTRDERIKLSKKIENLEDLENKKIDEYLKSKYLEKLMQNIDYLKNNFNITITSLSILTNSILAESTVKTIYDLESLNPIIRISGSSESNIEELDTSIETIGIDTFHNNSYDGSTEDILQIFMKNKGIETNHSAFSGIHFDSSCFGWACPPGNPEVDDTSNSHDTAIAGIICSNDDTYKGIAYDLEYYYIAALDQDSDMNSAIDWAFNASVPEKPDVILTSIPLGDSACDNNREIDAEQYVDVKNVNWVKAAGNSGPGSDTITSPGRAYNVITVGASNNTEDTSRDNDFIYSKSSRGPSCSSPSRKKPNIVAPGVKIMSTNKTGFADISTGTSFAAPHVAGAILLLEEAGVSRSTEQRALLYNTAENRSPMSNYNYTWGHGYLDMHKAYLERSYVYDYLIEGEGTVKFFKFSSADPGDRATIVWDRHVVSDVGIINNLSLSSYDEADGTLIYESNFEENTEQIIYSSSYVSILKVKLVNLSTGSDEDFALATSYTHTEVNAPTLSADINFSQSTLECGESFSINVNVTNNGNIKAHGVSVTLNLPSGLSITSGANPQSLGTIYASSSGIATWNVKATSAGNKSISADITSSSYGETYPANDSGIISVGTCENELYINIKTLKDNYSENELVNITDPPENALPKELPNYFITRDTAWIILKQDYLTEQLDFNFVYINDSYYRLDWEWDNEEVKKEFTDCSNKLSSQNCIEELHTKYLSEYNLGTFKSDFSYLKNNPLPKDIIKGNANLIGDINPFTKDKGTIYVNLKDGFYKSNSLEIKFGFDTMIAEFNNSKTTETLTFKQAGNITRYLKIKNNSFIFKSNIDLKGYEWIEQKDEIYINRIRDGMETKTGTYFWLPDFLAGGQVRKYNLSGDNIINYSISAYSGDPTGITWDGTYFWLVDVADNYVYKVDDSFSLINSYDISAQSQDSYGIAYYNNKIYISDVIDDQVYRYDTSGNYEATITLSDIQDLYSIVKFESGSFWGVSRQKDTIWKFDDSGNTLKSFYLSGNADYYDPEAISYDGTDIWIGDGAEIIYKLTTSYLINISIDSGDAGSDDYVNNSNFNGSVNDVNLNKTAIQDYLDSCSPDVEGYCYIPIVFYSDSAGRLEYSDIDVIYQPKNESKIINYGLDNTSVCLLMKIQYWNGSEWLHEKTILNDTSNRTLEPGEENQTKLDVLWNPNAWNTSTTSHGSGTYRAWAAATDENDIVLENSDGTKVLSIYNFNITIKVNKVLTIQNSSSENVAYFDDQGNIVLAGTCTSGGACTAPADSFIFKDSAGNEVAHIDPSGNLCIETGDCSGQSASCNPSNDAFIIQDSSGNNMSYIDLTNGDLCLTGILTQNGNP